MIVALIAAHEEDPRQLARAIGSVRRVCETVVVLASPDDDPPNRFFPRDWQGVHWITGTFGNEREKRNALLHAAAGIARPGKFSWYLTIDPDELLIDSAWLELLLERIPEELPAYPLPRLEPDGTITVIPAHLFRGDVQRYVYLDVGIEWRDQTWDLDPLVLNQSARMLPGWPTVVHYGSPRADKTDDGWYSEPTAIEYDRSYSYPSSFPGVSAWA